MSDSKGTCPVCDRTDRLLTKAGKLRHHNDPNRRDPRLPFGQRCEGSGQAPAGTEPRHRQENQ